MTTNIKIATASFLFLFSCQTTPKQTDNSPIVIDSIHNNLDSTTKFGQSVVSDCSSNVFVAMLKPGLDNVKAKVNGSTTFVAAKGQLILYWNVPHTAIIADGRSGYIPPEQLIKVDTPCFKFNFSKQQFRHEKDYELYQSAQRVGVDLNSLIKRIQQKENKALLQFFRLKDVVDGASAEEFPDDFWTLINLWTDKELSSFISNLDKSEKKVFCELLIESSYCNPYDYYKLYYPLVFSAIVSSNSFGLNFKNPKWIIGGWHNTYVSNTNDFEHWRFSNDSIFYCEGLIKNKGDWDCLNKKYKGYELETESSTNLYRIIFTKSNEEIIYEFKHQKVEYETKPILTYSLSINGIKKREHSTSCNSILKR